MQAMEAILQYKQEGELLLERVTVSSDAFGSLPVFDEQGKLVSYQVHMLLSQMTQLGESVTMRGILPQREQTGLHVHASAWACICIAGGVPVQKAHVNV